MTQDFHQTNYPTVRSVRQFADDRGYSYFPEFPLMAEGQVNLTVAYPGIIKAFHFHEKLWDHWVCLTGMLKAVLVRPIEDHEHTEKLTEEGWKRVVTLEKDLLAERKDKTWNLGRHFAVQWHFSGEHNPVLVSIPAGVLHGYATVGNAPCGLLYHMSRKYDAMDLDEWRVSWDAFGVDLWKVENK